MTGNQVLGNSEKSVRTYKCPEMAKNYKFISERREFLELYWNVYGDPELKRFSSGEIHLPGGTGSRGGSDGERRREVDISSFSSNKLENIKS